jgi:hypothetical protein
VQQFQDSYGAIRNKDATIGTSQEKHAHTGQEALGIDEGKDELTFEAASARWVQFLVTKSPPPAKTRR